MSFINNLLIRISSKAVGRDKFGNRYYASKAHDYLGRFRRQVIYNGSVEATKVPPMWHAWLHYMTDQLPNAEEQFAWQQEYTPHNPQINSMTNVSQNVSLNLVSLNLSQGKVEDKAQNTKYNKWTPNT